MFVGGCRKRWIHTAAVSVEAFIAMELRLHETPDQNPITAAVCVCSLRTPATQETGCCWPLCRHKSNADPSQASAASLLQLNDILVPNNSSPDSVSADVLFVILTLRQKFLPCTRYVCALFE
ncbi:hypothetical protein Q8A73_018814 [Channa argus]|nr:hypothetical protein Q8A73_018814 [Channa argus]